MFGFGVKIEIGGAKRALSACNVKGVGRGDPEIVYTLFPWFLVDNSYEIRTENWRDAHCGKLCGFLG